MKKILIYNSAGGLGEPIQLISLLLRLKNHYKKSKILYFNSHFEGKLREFNINIETLNLNLEYFKFFVSTNFTTKALCYFIVFPIY